MERTFLHIAELTGLLLLMVTIEAAVAESANPVPTWTADHQFRVVLSVNPRIRNRSNSPASVEIDFQSLLADRTFDEHTIEVVAIDNAGEPKVFDSTRQGKDRWLVPHRLDRLFGSNKHTLNFVVADQSCTRFAVYFDTIESKAGQPTRYHGLVGDGDHFCEEFQRREISASHFDQFVDIDGDTDLDLFRGGVEPYVYCWENVGGNRMVSRGRLANGQEVFTLPCSKAHRSWLTVAFYDVDQDGDQDFFPSFNDGPDAGKIIFYRNTSKGSAKPMTFERVGPLTTTTGDPLAGGAQAGGWFPSIAFVHDWDGDANGRLDALVGSNHRCWLYRGLGNHVEGSPQFAPAVTIQAGGVDLNLVNPRLDTADIDSDGDVDLFAGTQPGPVWLFENVGTRRSPSLAAGRVIAFGEKYLIGDAHSGVKVADFDGDGLLDVVAGRFWERTDLNHPDQALEFSRFLRNVGSPSLPRFDRHTSGAPFTEQFQICDAVRQNCVRVVDWNQDGRLDLLAGDTDGFIWFFQNESSQRSPCFERGVKLKANGQPLSVMTSGGHARFDICDWNHDGLRDLLVADGHGTATLFLNGGTKGETRFASGRPLLLAVGTPVQGSARASVLVCDWNGDGRDDVVFADNKGYYWYPNIGTAEVPRLGSQKPILFNGQAVKYVRPNLGSVVDWDGDGKRDFVGCHFENSIRLYRNTSSDAPNAEPQFTDPEGIVLLEASSPQMISGADAVDWNGDGDLDLLTGQGHGGSGLRFYERDWIEDELHDTHPIVTCGKLEARPR
jgi:hypothetical protein